MPRLLPRSLWLVRRGGIRQYDIAANCSGVRAHTPQTPKQQQMYAALPPYQVERATIKGHVFYVYKDEKAGVAYMVGNRDTGVTTVGSSTATSQNYYMAAKMDRAAAFGWDGAWGPRRYGGERLMLKDVSLDSNSTTAGTKRPLRSLKETALSSPRA